MSVPPCLTSEGRCLWPYHLQHVGRVHLLPPHAHLSAGEQRCGARHLRWLRAVDLVPPDLLAVEVQARVHVAEDEAEAAADDVRDQLEVKPAMGERAHGCNVMYAWGARMQVCLNTRNT